MQTHVLFVAVVVTVAVVRIGAGAPVSSIEELMSPAARFEVQGVARSECNDVFRQPSIPTSVPSWGKASAKVLKKGKGGVKKVGKSVGAFRKKHEIVIKVCTTKVVEAVFKNIAPQVKKGKANEFINIYFACGNDKTYNIPISKTLEFGSPASNTAGTFRLIAPDQNVEFDGKKCQGRLMKVFRNAKVTLYGLTFKNSKLINMGKHIRQAPPGGWNGAAVLASFRSTVIISKCRFINNWTLSKYSRVSSGAAVMAETGSRVYIWGSYFKDNHATNGGAVAGSMAFITYIAQSTFVDNIAHGGFDLSKPKRLSGVSKPTLQARGGAMRFDSVLGHPKKTVHIFVCNTKFVGNQVKMSKSELKEFGYKPKDAKALFAGASAVAVWNKQGTLNLKKGDHNLLTMRGCVFENNKQDLPWHKDDVGRYVFEARGAGHIDVADTTFSKNSVRKAVCGLDNSDFFREHQYDVEMANLDFYENGKIENLRFVPKRKTRCSVRNVQGMRNGKGDCLKLLQKK